MPLSDVSFAGSKVGLTFRLTKDPLKGLKVKIDGAVRDDVQRRAQNVRSQARANVKERARHASGLLEASILYTLNKTTDGYIARIGSDREEMLWFEKGTGIFGPFGAPIRARNGGFMVFSPVEGSRLVFRGSQLIGAGFLEPRRTRHIVFAKSVKGQPAKHPLRDALAAFSP